MYLRRADLKIGTPPRQLHQASCELSLECSAEGRVSLFRYVAMQNLQHFIIQIYQRNKDERGTIQSSLRLDIDTALMVTSGIFRSRDVTDLPSLAVVTRM